MKMVEDNDTNKLRESLAFTLPWEVGKSNWKTGGYTNDPDDPGGETKWGISKRAYPDVDIKNLTIEEAIEIYRRDYWRKSGASTLPLPYCTVVFDTAVNCGSDTAAHWLRKAANISEFLSIREERYIGIIKRKPTQQKYLRGWLNRLSDLKKFVTIKEQEAL